ncbi:MAG: 4Fe-4S dicluster domain-containing protein [Gemmatimonadota bacterium]
MTIGEGPRSTNQARHDYVARGVTVGFFTDPTVCIGCKACEVACKEWSLVPDEGAVWLGHSYDHTGSLGASSWRHVKFVEQDRALGRQVAGFTSPAVEPAAEEAAPGAAGRAVEEPFRWIFLSDVCKQCEHAGCLEACPTEAIQFGPLAELRERAAIRVRELQERGYEDACLYDAADTSVEGAHAFFLILGEPDAYGLPPRPRVPTVHLKAAWLSAFVTGLAAAAGAVLAFGLG